MREMRHGIDPGNWLRCMRKWPRSPPMYPNSAPRCSTNSCMRCHRVAPVQSHLSSRYPRSHQRVEQELEACSSAGCSYGCYRRCIARRCWPASVECKFATEFHHRTWLSTRFSRTSRCLQEVPSECLVPCTCLRSNQLCTCTARSEEGRSRVPAVRLRMLPWCPRDSCCTGCSR